MFGMQSYVVRSDGLLPRVEVIDALAYEDPATGGGVGTDGAFSELAFRDPTFIRLAAARSMTDEIFGAPSTIRDLGRPTLKMRALRVRQVLVGWTIAPPRPDAQPSTEVDGDPRAVLHRPTG